MKKTIPLVLSFILLTVLSLLIYFKKDKVEQWFTYQKRDHKKIDSYPTTLQEKRRARIEDSPYDQGQERQESSQKERSPASQKYYDSERSSIPGRTWRITPDQKIPDEVSFLNKPRKEWRDALGKNILKFLRPKTKLFVKKEGAHTLLKRDGALHVEKVNIKMESPEGRQFSYHAYVDSETGKIVKTWNQTIHEPMGKKDTRLTPSGHISPDGSTRY